MCQCLRCDFCRSTQRKRCKFHSLLGSVGKLSARQTLTFQPLPSITSVESAKIWKTRDQPKPGSLFGKMRDPGNEVSKVELETYLRTRKRYFPSNDDFIKREQLIFSPERFHFWKCFGPQIKTNNYPIRA